MSSTQDWNDETPLSKVTCTSHDCEKNLHSFLRMRPGKHSYRNERCRACGIDLIDWQRLDRHDLSDVKHTIESLERELIRHEYWHRKLSEKVKDYAKRKGLAGLRETSERRLIKSVGPARSELFRDGTQTPMNGNIINYAQHTTATCCRKCIEAWHGIDRERPLSMQEIRYMVELLMLYIRKRLPSLSEEGQFVPNRTTGTS